MPYHISQDGLKVLKEDGQPVPGGVHSTHEQALAHLRAIEANTDESKAQPDPDEPGSEAPEEEAKGENEDEELTDDNAPLPDVDLRAHPFGNPQNKDAHEEYFDRETDFHDELLPSVPVTYYHNHLPSGEWDPEPTAIGKTIARRYGNDGRWDKVRFNDDLPPALKARLKGALEQGRLRASPTVVPDFHEVDRNGHIRHWLTGSIAVLDADGPRQPASSRAIAIPDMKALYKAANITFPTALEDKKRMKAQMKGTGTMERIKAMLMQLLQLADGQDEEEHDEGETEAPDMSKSTFDDTRPEENAAGGFPNDLTNRSEGPQGDGTRFGNGARATQKAGNGNGEESASRTEGDSEPAMHLDWQRRDQDMKSMKAQISTLTSENDRARFDAWFESMLRAGRALPAERAELEDACLHFADDDRHLRPTMKAADGRTISRLRAYQRSVEARQPTMNISGELLNTMKAAGFDAQPSGDKAPMSEARHDELMSATPMGQSILREKGK